MKTINAVILTAGLTASFFLASLDALGAVLNKEAAEREGTRSANTLPLPPSAISSEAPGALKRPQDWTCEYLLPQYRTWLEEGNSPKDWPMFGLTYRDAVTGETYTWTDWIDWINKHRCSPVVLARPEVFPAFGALFVPLLGTAAGGGILVVSSGSGSGINDSPG